ncbi:TonB-dependent receptor [Algibacillus agarilyticus]|uniref:TonB-dependent receptor n=1 Tax=Algibacillus agarilyticus TaxID=2234133 RepID=UPI0018E5060E|nr:TonB-dependent receptor [Algibacillus agarilyticus]
MKITNKCTLLYLCSGVLISSIPFATRAQETSANTASHSALEIIEVTAQKRKQDNQKVGIALTALSTDNLAELALENTVSITQQVPNLQVNAWSPNLTFFNLRGISQNNFTDNLESPIAVYADNTYVGSMNSVANMLFDMQRVEVLRGPQSTLFGRNAIGGVIHYISEDASKDYFNGYVKAGFASYNTQRLETALGGSITDSLRARVALRKEQADGYINANSPNIRPIGGVNAQAIKFNLQLDLSDNILVDFSHHFSQDKDVPTGGYAFLPWTQSEIDSGYIPPELINFTKNVILDGGDPPNDLSVLDFTKQVFFNTKDGFTPVDASGLTLYQGDHSQPYKHFSNTDGYLNRIMRSSTAKVTFSGDNLLQFNSITNIQSLSKQYLEDGDGIAAPIIEFTTELEYDQWSQELQLSGKHNNNRWQLGAYYLNMHHDGLISTVGNPVIRLANSLKTDNQLPQNYQPNENSPKAIQDYETEADNRSLFGQYELEIEDDLILISALRWSQDSKELNYTRGFIDEKANIPLITQLAITPHNEDIASINYTDHAARLQLNYQATTDLLYFLSYNRGIKVGNWAFSASVTPDKIQHKPETLHAYEFGFKSIFLAEKIKLNATSFYYDYKDYQAFSMVGLAPNINNSDATASGTEIEFAWSPYPALNLQFGASYMTSKVEHVDVIGTWQSPVGGGTEIVFPVKQLTNTELPNAPKYSFNYALNYAWQIEQATLSIQLDGVHYDEQYLEVTNGGGAYQKAYSLLNANISYTGFNERMTIMLWGKNLTNEVYKQYNLDLGMLGSTAFYAPPSTYGISMTYAW